MSPGLCTNANPLRFRVLCMLQLTHYDANEDGVTLHFDRDQPSVRAKILVGADGYFSKVRKQCLDDGPPQFAVSCFSPLHLHQPNLVPL